MNKLILILLFITTALCGQDRTFRDTLKFRNGVIIVENGQDEDNIYILDSLQVHNLRLLSLEGADDIAPVIDSAVVYNAGPDTVYVYYDKAVTGGADTTLWSVFYADGNPRILTPIVGSSSIKIPIGDSVTVAADVSLTYYKPTSGGVVGVTNVQAESQIIAVTNRVEGTQTATLIEDFRFDGNTSNEVDGLNAVASGTLGYVTGVEAAEGTSAIQLDGTNDYVTTLTNDYTSQFSVSFAMKAWGNADYQKCLFEVGGLKLFANMYHRNLELWAYNASNDSAMASSDSTLLIGEWNHIVLTVDSTAKEAHFWIHSLDADVDTILQGIDFIVEDNMTIGADDDNAFRAYSYADFWRNYTGHLTQDDVTELYRVINPIFPDTIQLAADTAYAGRRYINELIVEMNKEPANTITTSDTILFQFFKDGSQAPLRTLQKSGRSLIFTIDSLIGGEVLRIRYDSSLATSNRLWDSQHIYADTFNLEAHNHILSRVNCLAHYPVNNSPADNSGKGQTATEGGGVVYNSTSKEGSHSLGYGGTTSRYIQAPLLDHDSVFTIDCWHRNNTGAGDDQYAEIFGTRSDGITLDRTGYGGYYDYQNGHAAIRVDDGSSTQTIQAPTGDPTTNTWIHTAWVIDRREAHDSVWIYVNGVLRKADAFTVNFPINEKIQIGYSGNQQFTGLVDAIGVYDTSITVSQAVWLHNNPGEILPSSTSDTTPDDPNFNIIWSNTFDHWDTDYVLPTRYASNTYGKSDTMINYDWWGAYNGDCEWAYDKYQGGENLYHNYLDSIVEDPLTNSPALKLYSKAGETNASNTLISGGESLKTYWDGVYDNYREVYFSYSIMFRQGFQHSGGGKLPGIITKAERAYGGRPVTSGEGARASLLFKGGGIKSFHWFYEHSDASRNLTDENGVDYSVVDDKWGDFNPEGVDYDDDLDYSNGKFQFRHDVDRWYRITQRIVWNTGTNYDGLFEGYINGYLIERDSGYRWTDIGDPTYGINGVYLQFFFGGYDPALRDEWILTDDYVVYTIDESYVDSKINRNYGYNDTTVVLPDPYWPKADTIWDVCVIGDGIMEVTDAIRSSREKSTETLEKNYNYNITSLATSGDLIANQQSAWDALSTTQKSEFEYVIVTVGMNDITLDGVNRYSTTLTNYQALVTSIGNDAPSAFIICYQLTPARGASSMSASEYTNAWVPFNTWMNGTLTGANLVSAKNKDDLKDGSDNLDATYDPGDGLNPNDAGHALMYTNFIEDMESLR